MNITELKHASFGRKVPDTVTILINGEKTNIWYRLPNYRFYSGDGGKAEAEKAPLVTVKPSANSVLGNRLPLIEIDLSKLDGVDPASMILRISGFGRVAHRYDATSGLVTYQVPQRLRLESCGVQFSFRHTGSKDNEVIGWTFQIDPMADYLSSEATSPGSNAALEKELTAAPSTPVTKNASRGSL